MPKQPKVPAHQKAVRVQSITEAESSALPYNDFLWGLIDQWMVLPGAHSTQRMM